MPEYSAGSASVRIRPNADDFIRDLNAKLRSFRDPGFDVEVDADTTPFREKVQRTKKETEKPVETQLEIDLKEAENKLRALRIREKAKKLDINVDVDADPARAEMQLRLLRTREEARNIELGVNVNTRGATAQLAAMRRQLEGFGRSDVFKLNLGAAGLAAVQPAVTGLVQLAGALQQVSQAALLVPGGIAAASASIGTLAIGLSGVADAYQAVKKASDSSGTDQAAQARAASAASNNLRNAVVDETRARKDQSQAYRDARNDLRDLNIEMRGGLISESRAILEAQKAREDLAKGDYTDVRDQMLRIAEADQRVLEVRARNADTAAKLNDANAKGIENSDRVVDANERLVRSQQQVADASAAVTAATTNQSATQKAAAQAMENLSPSAQKFVQKLLDMQPLWDRLKNSAQEPLFEGKAEEFEAFANEMAPRFESGMSRISSAWNNNISALFTSLSSDTGVGLIDRILGNTGEAQERLSKAVDPLVRGVGTLAAAGTDSLPRLAEAIGTVSARFANFIESADKDGRLAKWIDEGLDGMSSLGRTTLNVVHSITGITRAAGGGAPFLQWLEGATEKMREFLNSTEGQNKMREFFREGREQLRELGELARELPAAFQSMSDGVGPYIGSLIDLFGVLAELVGDHPDLVKAVLTAYLTWKSITPIITGVQGGLTLLSSGLTGLSTGFYRTRDDARKAMADVDGTFQKAGKGGSGLSKFSGALSALGGSGAGAGIMGALASIAIPGLVLALRDLDRQNQESEAKTRLLEQAQKDLESTVDRVTGKLTAQSRDALISQAQNYDTTGAPGGGIPNISKGDALNAATSLGIPGDVYADALEGKPDAVQKVRDILLKNNVIPELDANDKLSGALGELGGATGGTINRDLLAAALIGDPDAVKRYTEALQTVSPAAQSAIAGNAGMSGVTLTDIAQRLSPTGQASVLSGGALNLINQALPGVGSPTAQRNTANFGRFRIKPGSGANSPFPEDAAVNSSGTDYRVTVPGNLAGQLQMQGIPFVTNLDGTLTATVPIDSPYIEKYEKGGLVPGSGPRVAILHGGELVVPANEVGRRSFEPGGTVDEYGNPVHAGTGAAPGPTSVPGSTTAPIAANPMGRSNPGIISSLIGGFTSGIQGPIGNAIGLVSAIPGVAQGIKGMDSAIQIPDMPAITQAGTPAGDFASRMAGLPGFAGLFGGLASPNPTAAVTGWAGTTLNWLGNWGANTLGQGANILWQGGLNAVGLGGSVLSPSNPYNQAAQQVAGFIMGSDGPMSTLMGGAAGGQAGPGFMTDPTGLASQYGVDLDDQMLAQLYGQTGDKTLLQNMSPGAMRAIMYAQQHAVGQEYVYGGVGPGYDCSGIASSIYAAAMGLPQGTRYFTTESDFEALGFLPGNAPGALNIGVERGGGGPNSHMSVTLPNGVNVESGGSHGTTSYGGEARSSGSFPLQWHLPLPPGFREGGPTPSRKGPGPTGGYISEVHADEFMISARGRATVPDSFLYKLNAGLIDPKDIAGLAAGGPPPQALVVPPPRPNFQVPNARTITPAPAPRPTPAPAPRPSAPSAPAPAPAPSAPAAPPPAPAPTAPITKPVTPPVAAPPKIVAPNQGASGINHNIGWVSKLIESSASNLGQLASTAMSIAAMGAGSAGAPGAGAIGAAGPFVAGLFQQGGKIVEAAANVVSSSLVGSVPGSFGGEPGARAYGQTVLPEQTFPDGRMSASRTVNNTFNGVSDVALLMDRMELADKIAYQSELANYPK